MLGRFFPWWKPYRGYVAVNFVFQLLQVPAALVSPFLIKTLVDDAIDRSSVDRLYSLAGLLAFLTTLSLLFGLVVAYTQMMLRFKVVHRIRLRLYRHLQRLPLRYIHQRETGYLLSRQLEDASNLGGIMPDEFAGGLVNLLQAIAFGAALFYIEWRMAMGALVFAGLMLGYQFLISKPLRRRNRAAVEAWSRFTEQLHQALTGHQLILATASEGRERRRVAGALHRSMRAMLDRELFQLKTARAFGIVRGLAQPAIILAGIYLIVKTGFTIGDLFAFFLCLQQMIGAVAAVAGINPGMQRSLTSLERIFEVLDTEPEIRNRAGARRPPRLEGRVTLEGLSFAYDPEKTVLHDLDLVVEPHTTVALVGPSGAGKTTLIQLLARFYDPVAGSIRVDGVDLRDFDLRGYRQQLGIVPQDVFLFDRSIAENIAYGRPFASREEIRAAATAAHADEFITAMSSGYDTLVGERGVRLSGGQRQRLAIARELLRNPSLLILDEATSSLDSESEALVQAALQTLLRGRTAFVIAHRLSTVVGADLIVVLEAGRIVEKGRHAELIARGGLYARLYETQFRSQVSADAAVPAELAAVPVPAPPVQVSNSDGTSPFALT